jgi:hypothetical protein
VPTPQPGTVTVITVVRTTACHLCADARAALVDLGHEYPLDVAYLDATDPAGRELVARHRVAMFPLVLVDGQFFSHGRLPRDKLRQLLEARPAARIAGTR